MIVKGKIPCPCSPLIIQLIAQCYTTDISLSIKKFINTCGVKETVEA
jgi:hypothetical protein